MPATHSVAVIMTIILTLIIVFQDCQPQTVSYLNLERPIIDYYDPYYLANVTVTSRRYNRTDVHHYMTLALNLLKFEKGCTHSFNLYEILSAVNRRHLMELQYDFCDWTLNDNFLGAAAREAFMRMPPAEKPMPEFKCPLAPGRYCFKNVIIPITKMPAIFPFQDARIFYKLLCKNKPVLKSHADIQIIKKNNKV